jgi:tight adherence protein C
MSVLIPFPVVCAAAGLTMLTAVVAFFSRKEKRGIAGDAECLWDRGFEKLYDALFASPPETVGKALGLEYDKYILNCMIIRRTPNLKKEVSVRTIASLAFLLSFAGSAVLFAVTGSYLSVLPLIAGILVYTAGPVQTVNGVESRAKFKKRMLVADLPRFADLLHTVLDIGVPIDSAIKMTAKRLPGTLSDELLDAMSEHEMGAKSWQEALEDLARRYEADAFSDFVLDVVTSYAKGVSVSDAVARKSTEMKQESILMAKEKTARMSNTVLLPVTLFKIMPLLLIMIIPVILQIMNNF